MHKETQRNGAECWPSSTALAQTFENSTGTQVWDVQFADKVRDEAIFFSAVHHPVGAPPFFSSFFIIFHGNQQGRQLIL